MRGQVEAPRGQEGVRAVDRALQILLAFTPGDDELTVAELSARVALSRPTLYRLLGALEQQGFVTVVGEPQRFRLGPSIAHLSHVWLSGLNLRTVAEPMLRKLWKTTGETVGLFVREENIRRCVAELESPQPLSFRRGVGYAEQLVLGASGRAILAHLPREGRSAVRPSAGVRLPSPEELEAIRQKGYSQSRDELIKGAVAIAAPFFDGAGSVAGSICVFGPGVRFDDARISEVGTLLK